MLLVGGTTTPYLWRQILADVTGYPVLAADSGGEAALGNVMLAAVGVGLADEQAIKAWLEAAELCHQGERRRVHPDGAIRSRRGPHQARL